MNDLQVMITGKTMDSREIAELTGKRHDHVLRDIEQQLINVEGGLPRFGDTYFNSQNKEQPCYKLPYRETMILVSGYNSELRAKVIDRWMELEKQVLSIQAPTGTELLALAVIEAQRIILEKNNKIAIDAPKVLFYDTVIDSKDALEMNQVGKLIGVGRNTLFSQLRQAKVLRYNNEPYQDYIDRGWFKVIEIKYNKPNGDIGIDIKTLVTQKGVDALVKRYKKT